MKPAALPAVVLLVAISLAGCIGDGSAEGGPYVPPAARFSYEVADSGSGGHVVSFDASGSDGHGLQYFWEFGDGAIGEGKQVSHEYGFTDAAPKAVLTLLDSRGVLDVSWQKVPLGRGKNANPVVSFPLEQNVYAAGEAIALDASGSQDFDGDALTYNWYLGRVLEIADNHDGTIPPPSTFDLSKQSGFNSGGLDYNTYWETTFNAQGTYGYHCHPHPFMVGEVRVDPAATASERVDVYIKNFTFWPEVATVAPGTTVRWINLDQAPHSATQSNYLVPADVTGPTGSLTIDEVGVWTIALVVTDGKGGRAEYTHGVKVVSEAPPTSLTQSTDGPASLGEANGNPSKSFTTKFGGNATITLNWTAPPQTAAPVTLNLFKGSKALGTANQTLSGNTSPLTLAAELPANTWTWQVVTEEGAAILDWNLTVDVQYALWEPVAAGHHH